MDTYEIPPTPMAAPAGQVCPEGAGFLCQQIGNARRELRALQKAQRRLVEALANSRNALHEQAEQMRRMRLLGQESDHRLLNGLQLVASVLAMQARKTASPEAAEELQLASRRVATIGNLHRQLHGVDQALVVELGDYLQRVCGEVAEMLGAQGRTGSIRFDGPSPPAPRTVAIPLGFICAELLTNAAKHGEGDIEVRLGDLSDGRWSLSVADRGPGLPEGFRPATTSGLGMKIIASLTREMGGELTFGPGDRGLGTCFTVVFPVAGAASLPRARAPDA